MTSNKSSKSYFQTFKESYTNDFPSIQKSSKGVKFAFCYICRNDFSISHGGRNDVFRHVNGPKHKENVKCAESTSKLTTFFKKSDNIQADVTRAELLFTSFLIEHNVSLNAASHAGPLFRQMFPKEEIAKHYGCGRTKTTAIVHQMAHDRTSDVVKLLQEAPFSAACDGSHESDYKLYPIIVNYFNPNLGIIESTLLSIPNLVGNSTGENISSLIIAEFEKLKIPLEHCIAFSADNAAVMQGKKNGVISFLEKRNPNIISIGCCCHLINIASEKGAATLPVKVDEVLIDIFYYLKRSVNRKEALKSFQELCGKEAQKILKHVCTRWLSLGRSLTRLVNQWDPLTSFFKEVVNSQSYSVSASMSFYKIPKISEKEGKAKNKGAKEGSTSDRISNKRKNACTKVVLSKKSKTNQSTVLTREEKIFMFLSSDLNKAYSLFLLGVIPIFEKTNIVLQSSSPQIYRLQELLLELLKELFSKFVKPSECKGRVLTEVNFHSPSCHKDNQNLVIGNTTSNLVSKLSKEEQKLFYTAVVKYFVTACDYIIKKFPVKSEILKHAEVANLRKIEYASFVSLKYFVNLFPFTLKIGENECQDEAMDALEKEFCCLQLEDLSVITEKHQRIDVQWGEVGKLRGADGVLKFPRLASVIQSILLIPHSNAECERIFSLVKKNRTEFRSLMSNETLESLLVLKTQNPKPCFQQKFSEETLRNAKKATVTSLNSTLAPLI